MNLSNPNEPVVLSMSDVMNFKRCRKLFDLTYLRGLESNGDRNEAMQMGTDFHLYMEVAALAQLGLPRPGLSADNPMAAVASAYLTYKPLPEALIGAEVAYYTEVPVDLPGMPEGLPKVYVRTTLDLVYVTQHGIVGRDYKTFDKMPSEGMDDLDFQGRLYSTVLAMHHPGQVITFEWEHVRRELGRELKAKGYVEWTTDERYKNVQLVMSDIERETTWAELCEAVRDLLNAVRRSRTNPHALYRIDLKGVGPHSCNSCQVKRLCTAEYMHGSLTQADQELLTRPVELGARSRQQTILADPRIGFRDERDPSILNYYGERGLAIANGTLHPGGPIRA